MASGKKYKIIGYYVWDNALASYGRLAEIFYSEYDYASIKEELIDPITRENLRIELNKIYPDKQFFAMIKSKTGYINETLSSEKKTEELIEIIKKHKLHNFLKRKYPDSAKNWDDVEMDIKLEKTANSETIKKGIIDQIKARPGQLPQELMITDKSFISDGVIFTGEGTVNIDDYSTIDAAPNEKISTFIDGQLTIGEFCHIKPGTETKNKVFISHYSVIGKLCKIEENSTIIKSTLNGFNEVGRESLIENKILPEYCDVPSLYCAHEHDRNMYIHTEKEEKSEPLKSNVPAFVRNIGMNFKFSDVKTMEFYEFAHKEKAKKAK